MKTLLNLCIAAAAGSALAWQNLDFGRTANAFTDELTLGINIGNSLDAPDGETSWGNPPVTRDLIRAYKAKGFSVVRLPVTWHRHLDKGAPGHRIDPAWMARVKEIAGWILAEDLPVIINVHHDGLLIKTDAGCTDAGCEALRDLWTQIAAEFKDCDERVVFEAFNEVRHGEDWTGTKADFDAIARFAKTFYDTVRASGGNNAKRYLMIPTYAAGYSSGAVENWFNPNPADKHIIATLHCYEPGNFCIWGNVTKYDRATVQKRLDELFPMFRKNITDAGVPLILGEINAARRYYDSTKMLPNDDSRVRWAAHYATEAAKHGFKCILWDDGGGMGLCDRATAKWTHEEIVDAFFAGARGRATDELVDALAAKVRVDPATVWPKENALLKWKIDKDHYNCWGQTMGFGDRNGVGVNRDLFSSDENGNLHVDSRGAGGNMIHQQFWPDTSLTARRAYKAYVMTHKDSPVAGRKLVLSLKAAPGTFAKVKGKILVPGVKDWLQFGADEGEKCFFSENGAVARCEIPLPADARLDENGKGLSVELQIFPKTWGKNLPVDCLIGPIEIK